MSAATRRGRRLVFHGANHPLEWKDGEIADPVPGGVLLRTVIGGVCGSDAHRLSGDQTDPGRPVCFGHEGIGRIEALGEGRTADAAGVPVAVGDLVYWTPSGKQGNETPGMGWPPPEEVPSPASYQDYATLEPTNIFYKIPQGTDPEAVIAFGCAMPTAIGGFTRLGGVTPDQTVVIQGAGPVGLAAAVLAGLVPARKVIVIDRVGERLEAARRVGATDVLSMEDTTQAERAERIADLCGASGADVVIEATGRHAAFAEGISLLAPNGRYLIMGIYSGSGEVQFDPVRLNNLSQSIIGTLGPTKLDDFAATVQLAATHGERLGFAQLITRRFPLAEAEQAIRAVGSGEAIKAIVFP